MPPNLEVIQNQWFDCLGQHTCRPLVRTKSGQSEAFRDVRLARWRATSNEHRPPDSIWSEPRELVLRLPANDH
jgi:hypothetical protein